MSLPHNSNHPPIGASIKTEPIRNKQDIQKIKDLLTDKPRDLALFTLGINSNLGGGELLQLNIGQLRYMQIGDALPTKRGGKQVVVMNKVTYQSVKELLVSLPVDRSQDDMHLFQSAKGQGALTTQYVNNLIKKWCQEINLPGNYGVHTLRKTFGYHQLVTFSGNIQTVLKMFGCNSKGKLFAYLCVQESDIKPVTVVSEL